MKFSNEMERARRHNLMLAAYQTPEGKTFVRVSRGGEELADVEERALHSWITQRTTPKTRRPRKGKDPTGGTEAIQGGSVLPFPEAKDH